MKAKVFQLDKLYLVYKTDTWHSLSSRELLAVCSSTPSAEAAVKKQCENEGFMLTAEELDFLRNNSQTQNYEGPGEFLIETVPLDKMIFQFDPTSKTYIKTQI